MGNFCDVWVCITVSGSVRVCAGGGANIVITLNYSLVDFVSG